MDSIVKHEILRQIGETGVVAVIRARSPEEGIALGEALLEGGIRAVEVAMTTPGGLKVLESLAARLEDRGLLLGAGTVLDPETARSCILAGARYVVAPNLNGDVVRCCHRHGLPCLPGVGSVTELLQALEWGVDVVVHSATKYLAGHSDVLLGAAVVAPERADLLERLHTHRTLHGAIPGPMEAWLVLRGVRTLHVRLERASATAALLAERLTAHPAVERVRYPRFGAMLAVEVAGGADAAEAVCALVGVWTHSTSLGGVESQLERRRRHPLEVRSVPENLVRLSVGIEDAEDLWADLEQALRSAG